MQAADIIWPGGEHKFRLAIEHLRALQDKCDAGPAFILGRLASGNWFVDDVIEPIRLGLIGGGMPANDAKSLVMKHVDQDSLGGLVLTAHAVLGVAIFGNDDDAVGESEAADGQTPTHSPTAKSDGQAS